MLLDEPLSALDLKLRQEMRGELKNLQRKTGITFVFVTHDQVEALTMSDRIAVMSMGRLQQKGTPVEIYERPLNRFVAGFIGETNFIPARIASLDGGLARSTVGADIHLAAADSGSHQVGDKVTLALRPEKMQLTGAEDPKDGLAARVVEMTYLGTDTHYLLALDGADVRLVVRARNTIEGLSRFQIGDPVFIRVAEGAARVLAD